MKHLIRLLLILAVAVPARADESTSLEYKVKAVCLFNFAKYVEWPDTALASESQAIRVCIAGSNPFGTVFQSKDAPKEAQNHPLEIVELSESPKSDDVAKCHVLYWQKDSEKTMQSLSSTLQGHSVLTVSDKDSDTSVISFTLEDGKVRFKIKRALAQSLKLEISSQLLKLAIIED